MCSRLPEHGPAAPRRPAVPPFPGPAGRKARLVRAMRAHSRRVLSRAASGPGRDRPVPHRPEPSLQGRASSASAGSLAWRAAQAERAYSRAMRRCPPVPGSARSPPARSPIASWKRLCRASVSPRPERRLPPQAPGCQLQCPAVIALGLPVGIGGQRHVAGQGEVLEGALVVTGLGVVVGQLHGDLLQLARVQFFQDRRQSRRAASPAPHRPRSL